MVFSSSLQILRCFTTAKDSPGATTRLSWSSLFPLSRCFQLISSSTRSIWGRKHPAEVGILLHTASFCCFRFAGKKTTAGTRSGNYRNPGIMANPSKSHRLCWKSSHGQLSPGAERKTIKIGWTLKGS